MPAAAVDVILASATRERVVDRGSRHRALLPAVEHVLNAFDAVVVAERRIAGQARRQVDRHGPIGLVGDRVEPFAAVEAVRARPTGQHVVSAAPGDRVVAWPAIERLARRTSAEHVQDPSSPNIVTGSEPPFVTRSSPYPARTSIAVMPAAGHETADEPADHAAVPAALALWHRCRRRRARSRRPRP